jgi:hypothetical protein
MTTALCIQLFKAASVFAVAGVGAWIAYQQMEIAAEKAKLSNRTPAFIYDTLRLAWRMAFLWAVE